MMKVQRVLSEYYALKFRGLYLNFSKNLMLTISVLRQNILGKPPNGFQKFVRMKNK